MNVRGVFLYSALAISLFFLLIAVLSIVISLPTDSPPSFSHFSILDSGIASNSFYYVVNSSENTLAQIITSKTPLYKKVVILNPKLSVGFSNESLLHLSSDLDSLKSYGFSVSFTNSTDVPSDSIFIIPNGALPSVFLEKLNSTNSIIYYFGSTDLVIESNSIKRRDFSNLVASLPNFIHVSPSLDQYFESTKGNFSDVLLYSSLSQKSYSNFTLKSSGIYTLSIDANDSHYSRLLYSNSGLKNAVDMSASPYSSIFNFSNNPVYPNQKTNLVFSLNRSIGPALLQIKLNDKTVSNESLGRLTSENVFIRRLVFDEPGKYLVFVSDFNGTISKEILNVKKIQIIPVSQSGLNYRFSVLLDDSPVQSSAATVSFANSSSSKKYYIQNGTLLISAAMPKGKNTLIFEIDGQSIPLEINNTSEPLFDFYLKFGIPVFFLILIVFIVSKITRRPIYRIRFNSTSSPSRFEQKISSSAIIEAFSNYRKDLSLNSSPLSLSEFNLALKKYLTLGSDITEGNLESLLKKLEKQNLLKSHNNFYSLPLDGDPATLAILRIIRDRLIENGINFNQKGNLFETRPFQVGTKDCTFTKNALVVFQNGSELNSYLVSLESSERSKVEIKIQNGTLILATLENFEDYL